ncbi:hypothetical protein [Paenibacillus sp. 8b26]|uniref:hypothetical protein n=1 Tax=Paenibacillus sp. 8b26 TaxID=3424133 RepID=UPI003D6621E3
MIKSNRSVTSNPLFFPPSLTALRRRNPLSQSEHDRLVREIALYYHNLGKYVLADHINWIHGRPKAISNIVPDIEVYDSEGVSYIEVETLDSLLLDHSKSQYRVMNRFKNSKVFLQLPKNYDPRRKEKAINDFYKLKLSNIKLFVSQ